MGPSNGKRWEVMVLMGIVVIFAVKVMAGWCLLVWALMSVFVFVKVNVNVNVGGGVGVGGFGFESSKSSLVKTVKYIHSEESIESK